MLYYEAHVDERNAVKAAVQLAVSRYRDSYYKFVQGKPERLAYIDSELHRLACECAEAVGADAEKVESHLRQFLADEVAVTDPKRIDMKQQIGDETEGKDTAEVPPSENLSEEMDIKAIAPVMDEELTKPDATVDLNQYTQKLSCERCAHAEAEEDSIYCTGCNEFVLGTSEEDPLEKLAATCPACGSETETKGKTCRQCGKMIPDDDDKESKVAAGLLNCPYCNQPIQAAQAVQPGQHGSQYQCPNCGATIQAVPGQQQQQGVPGTQVTAPEHYTPLPPTGLGGGLYAKEADDMTGDPSDPEDPSVQNDLPQSPAQGDSTNEAELPPAVQETGGLAGVYSGVVEEMGNTAAAVTWSTPGDQDIQDVADTYGLDPDVVRQHLKIVADFGDAVAVNGDLEGDPAADGMVELDKFGGRIPTTEQQVDVESAMDATAQRTGNTYDDVNAVVQDAYGNDLGGQHYVSVTGEAHYYLPSDLVQQQPQTPQPEEQQQQPDQTQPTEQPEEAYTSSTMPRFKSLHEFLEWDRAQVRG